MTNKEFQAALEYLRNKGITDEQLNRMSLINIISMHRAYVNRENYVNNLDIGR